MQPFVLDAELSWQVGMENGNGLVAAIIATRTFGIKTFSFYCLTLESVVTAENHAE